MLEGSALFSRAASVVSAFAIDCGEQDRFLLPLHKHDRGTELLLVMEGEGRFGIGGREYGAGPETLLFYQVGVWHEEVSTKHPFRALHVGYRGLEVDGLPTDFFLGPDAAPVIPLEAHYRAVRELMLQIIGEFDSQLPESHLIANHLLGVLMARLAQFVYHNAAPETVVKPSMKAVQHAKRFMEENYRSEVTLERLAAVTFVSPYYLAHLFKQEVGVSPIRYLIEYRMEVARHYLLTTRLTMKEISELVGYESETSFHNLFKRMTGATPGRFREEHAPR